MFHNYYSTILKKKSIQFLFKDLQQSYKKTHIIISLINSKKLSCLEIKVTLQNYLGINKEKLNLFSIQDLLKVQEFYVLIKFFFKKMNCIANYFKKIILIESSYNLILYSFIQDRLKIKKLSIRAFFLKDEELFYMSEKANKLFIINNH